MQFLRVLLGAGVLASILIGGEPKAPDRKAQRQEEFRRRFDKDGNGTLDERERRAMQDYLKARKAAQASQPAASMPALLQTPPGVRKLADIEYARINGKPLLLDVYRPETVGRPLPVIVWIHGGAWVSGTKEPCTVVSFSAKGYAIVSMDYRLSGEAQFPAQINDCKAVIRWVRAHAAEYGFDPDRIGAAGGSAGGHLVALLGTSGDVKELEGDVGGNLQYSSRVKAICDLCGPTDMTSEEYVRDASKNEPEILEKALDRLVGGPWRDHRQAANMASPVYHITKDDPPFLIVHGDADNVIPVKHSQRLYDRMKAAGLDAKLLIVKGAGHGVGGHPGVLEEVLAFFDQHLKTTAGQ